MERGKKEGKKGWMWESRSIENTKFGRYGRNKTHLHPAPPQICSKSNLGLIQDTFSAPQPSLLCGALKYCAAKVQKCPICPFAAVHRWTCFSTQATSSLHHPLQGAGVFPWPMGAPPLPSHPVLRRIIATPIKPLVWRWGTATLHLQSCWGGCGQRRNSAASQVTALVPGSAHWLLCSLFLCCPAPLTVQT